MSPILGIFASQGRVASTSYESIATVTVGAGGSSSIDFTSIAGTYKHLQIRYITRNASATDTTYMRLNSDTGSNYALHILRGDGSTTGAQGAGTQTRMELPFASYSGATANAFGAGVIDILDYANTSKYKTCRTLGGADLNGSGAINLVSGLWQSTSAITSISIFASTGSIAQYSQFALYGIKG